jgi:hypothetical protein
MKTNIVKNCSIERNPKQMFNDELVDNINCKIFAKEPKMELDDWTYAYQKHLLKHDFVRFPNGSYNDYTESSTSSNAETSPDTNQMLNDLGLGDSYAVDKTNESNDTANDQDNDINTSQVSESDLIDREGDIKNYEENDENLDVEDDIIYIETVKATNTDYVNCGASTSRGRGGKTTINSAYYFSNEYLKTDKDEPI